MGLGNQGKVVVWYFVLWGVCTYAIFELFYKRTDYGGFPSNEFAVFFSLLLLTATGLPLFLYLRKNEIRLNGKRALLIITVLFASFLIFSATVSTINKSRVQWYIEDLKNQGFDVVYEPHYPYGHWGPTYVDTYSNLTSTARAINSSIIYVNGGVPSNFVFFVPSRIEIVAATVGVGYYIFIVE